MKGNFMNIKNIASYSTILYLLSNLPQAFAQQPYTYSQLEQNYSAFLRTSTEAIKNTKKHSILKNEADDLVLIKEAVMKTHKKLQKIQKINPPTDPLAKEAFDEEKRKLIQSMSSLQKDFKTKFHEAALKLFGPSAPLESLDQDPAVPVTESLPASTAPVDPITIGDWKEALLSGNVKKVKKILRSVKESNPQALKKLLVAAQQVSVQIYNPEVTMILHKHGVTVPAHSEAKEVTTSKSLESLEDQPATELSRKMKGSELLQAIQNNNVRLVEAALKKMSDIQKLALKKKLITEQFNPEEHIEINEILHKYNIHIDPVSLDRTPTQPHLMQAPQAAGLEPVDHSRHQIKLNPSSHDPLARIPTRRTLTPVDHTPALPHQEEQSLSLEGKVRNNAVRPFTYQRTTLRHEALAAREMNRPEERQAFDAIAHDCLL